MLICLAAEGNNLQALLSSHFERAKYFLFISPRNREMEAIANRLDGQNLPVYRLAGKSPSFVITGHI